MLAVPKKNGKIRISLDPKDLNKPILLENYPMATIEDIATRLHGAKVFSVLDAKNGFWHVKLDEESSHLTTFHTPWVSGLKLRRKHGVISRLPSHKPLFCAFTACKMRLLSNATLLTQGLEPLCFSFSSQ